MGKSSALSLCRVIARWFSRPLVNQNLRSSLRLHIARRSGDMPRFCGAPLQGHCVSNPLVGPRTLFPACRAWGQVVQPLAFTVRQRHCRCLEVACRLQGHQAAQIEASGLALHVAEHIRLDDLEGP